MQVNSISVSDFSVHEYFRFKKLFLFGAIKNPKVEAILRAGLPLFELDKRINIIYLIYQYTFLS